MNEIPTDNEMADTYLALMSITEKYGMIYGTPRQTLLKVLKFWGKLGLRELEKTASGYTDEALNYEPQMKGPTFPIYDENCNIISQP
jgi:hypothetical protein